MRRARGVLPVAFVAAVLVAAAVAVARPDFKRPAANPAPAKAAPAPAAAKPFIPPPADIDRESEPVVQALQDAMGGLKTWDAIPAFRFDFVVVKDGKVAVRYKHWWDKKNGRARVEGPDDAGKNAVAIFRLSDQKGMAFLDGIGVSDPTHVADMCKFGYERWVNDTYWVMMPFKLRDPGVRIRYDRPEKTPSASYDVIQLSFVKGTGLTSDDHYWLFVNRATHLVDKWEMVLTGQKPPPSSASWEAWTNVGPVKLSLQRRFPNRPAMLRFENVAVSQGFDESVFTNSAVR